MKALLRILAFSFLAAGFLAGAASAETVKASSQAESGLVSKEGQAGTLKKRAEAAAPAPGYKFDYKKAEKITKDMEPVEKSVTGEVGVVIKMGMNVVYEHDKGSSTEMWVDFTKGTKVAGVKSLAEFKPEDLVKVDYVESKDGTKRAVRMITLVKRKTAAEKAAEAKLALLEEKNVISKETAE
ncbi:MAG TPA: hypothetical protein VL404_05930 [Candidatus Eisenbacteria bacterium]|jgi:hypothetical protein|nr:hypothetical protein [Candidatus Eisenbacteria bacterium]